MQRESSNPLLLTSQQQLYDYALQLRFNGGLTTDPYAFYALHQHYNSRFYEQPKPSYSYIGLIAMAILSTAEQQLVLSDIYQWILDHYPYFRSRGFGWRNSIRHNLSLNDCFVKAGRSTNGKGHYWRIHPANLSDFINGDFRRRRAQRRARKSMGLSVSGDEEDDDIEEILPITDIERSSLSTNSTIINYPDRIPQVAISPLPQSIPTPRKRCFDVASLLAPDQPTPNRRRKCHMGQNEDIHSPNYKSDGSTDTDISV